MSDIDTIKRAKRFIDLMANGVNPVTGEAVSANDSLNNIRISRCLFFVSNILRDVINDAGTEKKITKYKKRPFYVTDEELQAFKIIHGTSTISFLAKSINNHINDEKRLQIKYKDIANWLTEFGYLQETEIAGSKKKIPSEAGNEIGITTELRSYDSGVEALVVLLNEQAQQFIIDHLKEIANYLQEI